MTRAVAYLDDANAHVRECRPMEFTDLPTLLTSATVGEKRGPAWIPADIKPGPRRGERVASLSFLVLDVEALAKPVKSEDGHRVLDEHGDPLKQIIGPEPQPLTVILEEIRGIGWRCIGHTTYSHHPDHPRYRMVFDLSRPLARHELRPLGLHVAALLGVAECFDHGALEPARLYFLPRCPAERLPLFEHDRTDGKPLQVDDLLSEARRAQGAVQASVRRRREQAGGGERVIDAFNAAHDLGALLEQHGYLPKWGRRWLHPDSTSGAPGVRLLLGATPERVYSSHGSCALNDGHAHDAFDVYRILQHDGDLRAAVREAAELLGMDNPKSGNREDRSGSKGSRGSEYSEAFPDDPEPLAVEVQGHPYPIEVLPEALRNAVLEVQADTQAPLAMVATSMLGALAVVAQGYIDVERDERRVGPVSLFVMILAESGERKTTVERAFTKAIKDYEKSEAIAARPLFADFTAALSGWEEERKVLVKAVGAARDQGKATGPAQAALAEHERNKPTPPRVPRLSSTEQNYEGMRRTLTEEWPALGLMTSEGGLLMGSHGMQRETAQRNLALWNALWDGGSIDSGRAGGRIEIDGARLSVSIQVQPSVFVDFLRSNGGAARGIGTIARFLLAFPKSTQGTRFYQGKPKPMPALDAFNRRIATILEERPFMDDGRLCPLIIRLSDEALVVWADYLNHVEAELGRGGTLEDVRDVASKSAENAARLAALLHFYERGTVGQISREHMESGAKLAAWYLDEARRFLGQLAIPVEHANAARLLEWMIGKCKELGTNELSRTLLQKGPKPTRSKNALNAALEVLAEAGYVRFRPGRGEPVKLNPKAQEREYRESRGSNPTRAQNSGSNTPFTPGTPTPTAHAPIPDIRLGTCGGCRHWTPNPQHPDTGVGTCDMRQPMGLPSRAACQHFDAGVAP